jgi:hypothetical protein
MINRTTATTGLLTALLTIAGVAGAEAQPTRGALDTPPAHVAASLKATDTAHLRYVKHTGSLLFEEGAAHGTLPGNMRAYCSVGGTFTASFTISLSGGTIKGHGTASPHGEGIYESFAGTLTVTGGSGRYTHAHGHAGLYGTFNRRTYAMVVQTTGSLSY